MTRLALTLTAIGIVAGAAAACSDSGNTLRQPYSDTPNTSLPPGYSQPTGSSSSDGTTIEPTPKHTGAAPDAGDALSGYDLPGSR